METTNQQTTPSLNIMLVGDGTSNISGMDASYAAQRIQNAIEPFPRVSTLPANHIWSTCGGRYDFKDMTMCQDTAASTYIRFRDSRAWPQPAINTLVSTADTLLDQSGFPAEHKLQHSTYPDGFMITIIEGIGPGEIERPIRGRSDWTTDWDWVLSIDLMDATALADPAVAPKLLVSACFFFDDLPNRVREGVPWRDKRQTMIGSEVGAWGQTGAWCKDGKDPWNMRSMFCDVRAEPRWCGWVWRSHRNRQWLIDNEPLDMLSSPRLRIHKAEMDQRTGTGRFKKVMWYRANVAYGNDLTGEPMSVWDAGLELSVMDFCSHLAPMRRKKAPTAGDDLAGFILIEKSELS